ncbi:beta-1,3-glucosyltransferase-like isoform X1 [Scylla paramamosain]|uniref:beta-1,3-glucosyltransferase-like isoform X1 n=1 Tax=Scylla paramamosain TaxID=85552 RepID=UPI003083C4C6
MQGSARGLVIVAVCLMVMVWITVGASSSSQHTESLVFIIVDAENSMPNAHNLAASLSSQAAQLDVPVVIYSTSREWPDGGSWTYFPMLDRLNSKHGSSKSWMVFVGKHTKVKMANLLQVLSTKESSQLVFMGRGLQDQEETIIHHFARVDPKQPFLYPDVRAGMVLSGALITRLSKKWAGSKIKAATEINIDASYEFGSFVKSAGIELTTDSAFCVKDEDHCAILYSPPTNCGKAADVSKIHFAIKSWQQNHNKRLPILYGTWLKQITNYAIYSDVEDSSYGTVSLGVPNTEQGHCGKTMAIIRHAAQMEGMHWLFIADDDTLLSTEALSELLACHDHTQPVALGERYGYAAALPHGYDYITGGGGMVFSKPLVKMLASPGVCQCPSNDTPDDMFLGICLRILSIPITHSSAFHQARPMDYPKGRLEGEWPVSFHKFWMVDPYHVFSHWLQPRPPTHPQDEL